MSADVCGSCHGEPLRHARFQQWEDSAHGNFEGPVGDSKSTNTGCAGCHTAQGFMVYLAQLQGGNPLRTILSGTTSADVAMPVTCSVCHDPHAQGTTSGKPNTATVRVEDNTPLLPGGFVATGVGRGAMCIVCHNSRNGAGTGAFANSVFLHMDGDPIYGSLTSYAGPHEACQGDMVMGYNAYFVGSVSPTNSQYRSPHSLITGACVNCHMEQTPPPALLSYSLAGTNHSFRVSLDICSNCHSVNQSLGPMLQEKVRSGLEALEKTIGDKILSRNTVTNFNNTKQTIIGVKDLGSRGTINVILSDVTKTVVSSVTGTVVTTTSVLSSSGTVTSASLSTMLGIRICTPTVTTNCLETDDLAKALWNFYLIEQDLSFGVHNPDFTLAVLGASQHAVDLIANTLVPSNEL
jgi:hypothetical protein